MSQFTRKLSGGQGLVAENCDLRRPDEVWSETRSELQALPLVEGRDLPTDLECERPFQRDFDHDGVQPLNGSPAQARLLRAIRDRKWMLKATPAEPDDVYQDVYLSCVGRAQLPDTWKLWQARNGCRRYFRQACSSRYTEEIFARQRGNATRDCCSELETRERFWRFVRRAVRYAHSRFPRLLVVYRFVRRQGMSQEQARIAAGYGRTTFFKHKRKLGDWCVELLTELQR